MSSLFRSTVPLHQRVLLNALATFAVLLLAGCGGDDSSEAIAISARDAGTATVSDASLGDSGATDLYVTKTIGAAGGTVLGPDGASVTIPAGALTTDVSIRIGELVPSQYPPGLPVLPPDWSLLGNVFSFEPHGQTFLAAVTITVPSPVSGLNLQLVRAAPSGSWEVVPGATFAGSSARVPSTHFSFYGVIGQPVAIADAGAAPDAAPDAAADGGAPPFNGGDAGVSCSDHNGGCAPNATCASSGPGTVSCTCNANYTGSGTTCTGIDACAVNNGGCAATAACTSTGANTATCACNPGYTGNGTICTAIDSCLTNNGGCDPHAACNDTGPGANSCSCNAGYSGTGQAGNCAAIDTCVTGNGGCDPNATCTTTGPGANSCACKPGYAGSGTTGNCSPVNACLTNHGGCDPNAACTSTGPGTSSCSCNSGYSGDGTTCTGINACATNNGGCDTNAACTSTGPGTSTCACNAGYSGTGQQGSCAAVDSCLTNRGGCDANATCTSTGAGTNSCACIGGYAGNGQSGNCSPIDSCLVNGGGCDAHATCTSTGPGTNSCACNQGYAGTGDACAAVDSCATGNGGCSANATCTSTGPGTNSCACNVNYTGDGTTCTGVNSCATNNGGCDAQAACTSTGPGTNSCACNNGYAGNGMTCTAIDACTNGTANCDANATCTDTGPGTYTCACNAGYSGTGLACSATNSCLSNNGGCDAHATCTSTGAGTNTCACNSGYEGTGTTCAATGTVGFTAGAIGGQILYNGAAIASSSTITVGLVAQGASVGATSDGHYSLAQVPTGTTSLGVYDGTCASNGLGTFSFTVAGGETTTANLDITPNVGVLTATVTANGVGLAGATLTVAGTCISLTSTGNGDFTAYLPPGTYTFDVASAQGVALGSFQKTLVAGSTTAAGTVGFTVGTLAGTVLFGGAAVVSSPSLSVALAGQADFVSAANAGQYSLGSVPPGQHTVAVYNGTCTTSLGQSSFTVVGGGTTTGNVDIAATAGRLNATITVDGSPFVGGTVTIGGTCMSATTDGSGAVQMYLPPGSYTAELFSAQGVEIGTFPANITAGATATVNPGFVAGAAHGTLSFNGAPVVSTTSLSVGVGGSNVFVGATSGAYSVPDLSPGSVTLGVYNSSCTASALTSGTFTIVPGQQTTANLDLTASAGLLAGTATVNGTPLANGTVTIVNSCFTTTTDASGNFALYLPPGTYTGQLSSSQGITIGSFNFSVTAGQTTAP